MQGSLLKERAEMLEGTESFKIRREEAEATRSKQEDEMLRLTQASIDTSHRLIICFYFFNLFIHRY